MRLIILAILLYVLYRIVKNYINRPKTINRGEGIPKVSDMVQDPVCKTFIRAKDAETRVIDGQVYHFCSKECAARFEEERARKN